MGKGITNAKPRCRAAVPRGNVEPRRCRKRVRRLGRDRYHEDDLCRLHLKLRAQGVEFGLGGELS